MPQQSKPTIRHKTTQAAVADMLRSEILQGKIPPGTRLLQNEIAENFETSTTPVREALRQLVAEGLLDGDAHRGVTVHQTSSLELSHIYELRLALEPLAMKATAGAIGDRDLDIAEDLVRQMDTEDDSARWIELNASFHRVLAESGSRPLLTSIVDNLRNLSSLYIAESLKQADRRVRANLEHRMLVEHLRSHDVDLAIEAERSHIEHTLELGMLFLENAAGSD